MAKSKSIGGMSKHEVQMLKFLRAYIKKNTYAPSNTEMCEELGFKSTSGPSRVLDHLESRSFIRRIPGKYRAIEITGAGMNVKL